MARYIMSANENSDSESSMGKFSAHGYQYEPEYSMYLYKLDQHSLQFVYVHKYGNVVNNNNYTNDMNKNNVISYKCSSNISTDLHVFFETGWFKMLFNHHFCLEYENVLKSKILFPKLCVHLLQRALLFVE